MVKRDNLNLKIERIGSRKENKVQAWNVGSVNNLFLSHAEDIVCLVFDWFDWLEKVPIWFGWPWGLRTTSSGTWWHFSPASNKIRQWREKIYSQCIAYWLLVMASHSKFTCLPNKKDDIFSIFPFFPCTQLLQHSFFHITLIQSANDIIEFPLSYVTRTHNFNDCNGNKKDRPNKRTNCSNQCGNIEYNIV